MKLEPTWEGVPRRPVSVFQEEYLSHRRAAVSHWEVKVTLECRHVYAFNEPSMVEVPDPFPCLDCLRGSTPRQH